MLRFKGSADLRRIVVLNPKGGSGKTTLAFNLAGYIASTGHKVALVDMDRQGSSARWLQNRSDEVTRIHGISVTDAARDASGDQCIVVPEDINYAVIDAPAGLAGRQLIDYTCGAHAVLIPVLPSDLDIHAAARLVSDLLLVAQISRRNGRLGVIANRVNVRTIAYQQLTSFLDRLSITVVGTFRDSQNYVRAASSGLSIHEMQTSQVSKDLAQWEAVTEWLESRLAMPLTARDLLRPAETAKRKKKSWLNTAILVPATAMALLVVSLGWWTVSRDVGPATPIERAIEPAIASEGFPTAPPGPVEVALRDDPVIADAGDELKQKWQLSGIVRNGDTRVMILSDRHDKSTRRIGTEDDLDGWTVMDTGSNYAVFSHEGEEVRLVLNDAEER